MNLNKIFLCLTLFCLFIVLFMFFCNSLAFLPYNGDDWRYLAQYRGAIPIIHEWNPARVLPEVIQPLFGFFVAFIIRPEIINYPYAINIMASLLAAFCNCCLFEAVRRFLYVFTKSEFISLFGMLLFFAFSFCVFNTKSDHNFYLLYSPTLTLLFFYTIPNIMNSIIALWLFYLYLQGRIFPNSWTKRGMVILFTYFAIFSMTTASLILATSAGTLLLFRYFRSPGHNLLQKIKFYYHNLKGFDFYIWFVLLCWILAAILDMGGGRYAWQPHDGFQWHEAWTYALSLLREMNIYILIIIAVSSFFAFFVSIFNIFYRKNKISQEFLHLFCIIFITEIICTFAIFMMLAKVKPEMTSWIQAVYAFYFFMIILSVFSISFLINKYPAMWLCVPLLLCYFLADITRVDRKFIKPYGKWEYSIVEKWMEEIRRQDQAGNDKAVILIPKRPEEWPHPREWFGRVLSDTLYGHSMTSRKMQIELKEMDEVKSQ